MPQLNLWLYKAVFTTDPTTGVVSVANVPQAAGPALSCLGGSVVLTELGGGQGFNKHSLTLAAADARAILACAPFTLCEIEQEGTGTIAYGYVLNPKKQITDRDEHTITLELAPLTWEATNFFTHRGWQAEHKLSVICEMLLQNVPGWFGKFVAKDVPGEDLTVLFTTDSTFLGAYLDLAAQYSQYVRLGVDSNGAPARILEMGQFGAIPTTWLASPNGGDPDEMATNSLVKLAATVEQDPNSVDALVNVCTPFGGGQGSDALVSLEPLWRIVNDPSYPNYGKWGTAPGSVFPEYDVKYPISDPLTPATGAIVRDAQGRMLQGANNTRHITRDGHFDYVCYDYDSYYGSPTNEPYGHREGRFIDSGLVAAGNGLANQENAARALYLSTIANFKRKAHPHHTFRCTTLGTGRPTLAGDLISVDYRRLSTGEDGTVVEMDVTDNLRVMSVTRTFQSDAPPMDAYVTSNLGRFEDDDAGAVADFAKSMVAMQINQGTSLAPMTINGEDNVDALHPLSVPVAIPRELFRWHRCTLRVDFMPYTATATTAQNTPGTPISFDVPHDVAHNLSGAGVSDTGIGGTTDGFDLVQTGVDNDAVVQMVVSNDGSVLPAGQNLQAQLVVEGGNARWRLFSSGVPNGRTVGSSMKINFTKAKTKSPFTAAVNKAVSVASKLTALLPQHTHPLDQRIPDGPLPPSCLFAIDGQSLTSGAILTSGTRNADGTFATTFELDNVGDFVQKPGETVILTFTPGTAVGNGYGVGKFKVTGTWFGEFGGLTSTFRLA